MQNKNIVYQIYPKSFLDTSNNGYGDLNGIIKKLDYIEFLGVDFIWITPFYNSPQRDNGYDVSDYCSIDPLLGTMDDFDNLLKEAKKRNIKIMIDMVLNHTSIDHEWFQKALAGNSKYQDYYILKDTTTNWVSKFGGSTWKWEDALDKYYLHLFDTSQADLNWENQDVIKEIYNILNFWAKKGVNGFRFDVINLIGKPDVFTDSNDDDGRKYYTDNPKTLSYLQDLGRNVLDKYDLLTVGEMSSTTIEACEKYLDSNNKCLDNIFQFHHLKADYQEQYKWSVNYFNRDNLKNILANWQDKMANQNFSMALFWSNHDQPRIANRFFSDSDFITTKAKMFAIMQYMFSGVLYIYQGEEIGMTNAVRSSIDEFTDIESINFYNENISTTSKEDLILALNQKSRDNARTPMQWDDSSNCGFSTIEPWILPNGNYKEINVEKQLNDQDSVLNFYRNIFSLRKKYDVITNGSFELVDSISELFIYKKLLNDDELLVITNISDESFLASNYFDINNWEILLNNYPSLNKEIEPYMGLVLIKKKG